MAGNGALLRHAPNVSGCALAFEEVLRDAGFPDGLFRTLLVGEPSVAETTAGLLADPRIAAVTITGSDRAGAQVAAAAMDPATQVGPPARADLVDGLDRQVRESVAKGARVLTGGRRVGGRGCFYAPPCSAA
jgi:acyl-CoA reductase-like NAD-dependent aldehyde dehydrogenase